MLKWILIFALMASLLSLAGGVLFLLKEKIMWRLSRGLVSFAAGSLLGAAFLDLLPEAETEKRSIFALLGIIFFFLIEKSLIWHHCHNRECKVHYRELILLGDSLHNFIDGIIIAASFLVSFPLGVLTSFAVIAHEIPQEIADFGVLFHSGMKRKNIIIFNILTAMTTLLGAFLTWRMAIYFTNLLPFLLAFAAGGFIYIALADLIPVIHQERISKKIIFQIFLLAMGILVILGIKKLLNFE